VKKHLVRTFLVSIVTLSCLSILSLSACGKKGPLYIEDKPQPVTTTTNKDKKSEE